MEKSVYVLAVLIVSMLFVSAFVHAAGTSTGEPNDDSDDNSASDEIDDDSDDSDDDTNEEDDSGTDSPSDLDDEISDDSSTGEEVDCEVQADSLKGRIKCRIENKGRLKISEEESVPESCRPLSGASVERCKNFYNKIRPCYTNDGTGKDKCIKKMIGFARAKLKDENPSEKNQKARDYVVALLYDLQDRVEKLSEEGQITSDEAAELVEKITEIKTKILSDVSKNEIRPLMQELKQKWRVTVNE